MNAQPVAILIAFGIGIAFVVITLMLGGNSSLPEPEIHGASDYQNSIISIKRTSCFGYCPDYTMTVYGNGTVLFEGHQFVKMRGNYNYTIPKADVSKLVDTFYETGFFSMANYHHGCNDCPLNTVTIYVDGRTKTVVYGTLDDGSGNLRTLDRSINELSGSDAYVRCTPKLYCEK